MNPAVKSGCHESGVTHVAVRRTKNRCYVAISLRNTQPEFATIHSRSALRGMTLRLAQPAVCVLHSDR